MFLDINGVTVERESEALYDLTMGIAEGRIDKSATALELARAAGAGYASADVFGLEHKTPSEVGVSVLGSPNRRSIEPGLSLGSYLSRWLTGARERGMLDEPQ